MSYLQPSGAKQKQHKRKQSDLSHTHHGTMMLSTLYASANKVCSLCHGIQKQSWAGFLTSRLPRPSPSQQMCECWHKCLPCSSPRDYCFPLPGKTGVQLLDQVSLIKSCEILWINRQPQRLIIDLKNNNCGSSVVSLVRGVSMRTQ